MPFGKSGMVIFFNFSNRVRLDRHAGSMITPEKSQTFMVFNTNAGFYLEKIADV
jgi:hypothetical protein